MARRQRQTVRARNVHRRPLRFEPLEDRRLLAAVTVTNASDAVNGATTSIDDLMSNDGGDGISLREAIEAANATDGVDTIDFDAAGVFSTPQTIQLVGSQLAITDHLSITGTGMDRLSIKAHDPTPGEKNGDGTRVLLVSGNQSMSLIDVTFEGLTITGGDIAGFGGGGGIQNSENLTLNRVAVTNNALSTGGIGHEGAGIGHENGHLVIVDSVISGNSAFSTFNAESGGGIYSAAELTIVRSTIAGNSVEGGGGGVYVFGGNVSITDSTFTDNSATTSGGGLHIQTAGVVDIRQNTISGNSANAAGGGVRFIVNGLSTMTFAHNTVTNNTADADENGTGGGGGLTMFGAGVLTLSHNVVASNFDHAGDAPDINNPFSGTPVASTFNLIGDDTGSGLDEAPTGDDDGNLIGGPTNGVIDPLLGPLAYNGGPVFDDGSQMLTHALMSGSPAIDAGDMDGVAGEDDVPEFDQRGMPFGRIINGDLVLESRIDLGAVESHVNPLPGDYNRNGVVDAADYSVWRDTLGSTTDPRADGSGPVEGVPDGVVDEHDYVFWVANFGNVLEEGAGSGGLATANLRQGAESEGQGASVVGANLVGSSVSAESVARALQRGKAEGGRGKEETLAVNTSLADTVPLVRTGVLQDADSRPDAAGDPLGRNARSTFSAVARRDRALLAWLAARTDGATTSDARTSTRSFVESSAADTDELEIGSLDEAFAAIATAL